MLKVLMHTTFQLLRVSHSDSYDITLSEQCNITSASEVGTASEVKVNEGGFPKDVMVLFTARVHHGINT
jgi:hypothetical protein